MKGWLRALVAQAVLPQAGGVPVIDRASATDLAFLAMDSGPVGEQIGVIRRFEVPTGLEVVDVRRLIAQRIAAVPRLRQRLVGVPFGCGRTIWRLSFHFLILIGAQVGKRGGGVQQHPLLTRLGAPDGAHVLCDIERIVVHRLGVSELNGYCIPSPRVQIALAASAVRG